MAIIAIKDSVLTRIRAALEAAYGQRLARVLLFGSRARGDARPASDYGVAVFLHDMTDRWAEARRLADVRVAIMDETDTFLDVHANPIAALNARTPLMHEIRQDGVDF
jgi:predicted nucleotidyltransferase